MIPGEIQTAAGDITLNDGRDTRTLTVANSGDRPVQIGSHYHFYEVNDALRFDREQALGYRLNIATGAVCALLTAQTVIAHSGDHSQDWVGMLIYIVSQPDHVAAGVLLFALIAGSIARLRPHFRPGHKGVAPGRSDTARGHRGGR